MLVTDFLAGYAGNTAKAYRRDLADFVAFQGDVLAATRADVNAYVRSMETRELSVATIARRLATISGLYAYAMSEGLIERNPAEFVRRPKVSQESQTLGLGQDEARALLAAARADGARSYALVSLLLHTGARIGEALALTAVDLHIDGGYRVVTFHGKGGKQRCLPLGGAAAAVDELLAGRTDGLVFVSRTGTAWAQSEAFRTVQRLALAAGIQDAGRISPHSLRHTAISLALVAGAPLHTVQDFAGHSDPKMTRRYSRAVSNLENSPVHLLGSVLVA